MALRRVLKNFNLLNCILVAASLIFAYNFLFPQSDANVAFVLPPVKKPVEKTQNEAPRTQTPSPMEYVVIADQNLFHPERRIPPEKKEAAALPKPEFILYGTLITPNLKVAYLEDKKAPVTTPGRGKRQTALKAGESLSGFTLREILADKVVLTRGEETLSVLLNDPHSSKTREISGPSTQPAGMPGVGAPVPGPVGGQPPRSPVLPGRGAVLPSAVAPGSTAHSPMTQPSPQFPTNGGGAAFPSRR